MQNNKNIKAIYKKTQDVSVQKHNTITTQIENKYDEVANKLFSWALVHQVATCHFHACVYRRRSFYRIFNALTMDFSGPVTLLVDSTELSYRCGDDHLYVYRSLVQFCRLSVSRMWVNSSALSMTGYHISLISLQIALYLNCEKFHQVDTNNYTVSQKKRSHFYFSNNSVNN